MARYAAVFLFHNNVKHGFPKIEFANEPCHREFLERLVARYSAVSLFHNNVKIDYLKTNLLPNRVIENFWDDFDSAFGRLCVS